MIHLSFPLPTYLQKVKHMQQDEEEEEEEENEEGEQQPRPAPPLPPSFPLSSETYLPATAARKLSSSSSKTVRPLSAHAKLLARDEKYVLH